MEAKAKVRPTMMMISRGCFFFLFTMIQVYPLVDRIQLFPSRRSRRFSRGSVDPLLLLRTQIRVSLLAALILLGNLHDFIFQRFPSPDFAIARLLFLENTENGEIDLGIVYGSFYLDNQPGFPCSLQLTETTSGSSLTAFVNCSSGGLSKRTIMVLLLPTISETGRKSTNSPKLRIATLSQAS